MEPDSERPFVGLRTLLVDDDLFFSARILSVLKQLGGTASVVRTLAEAAEKTRDGVDLVILNFGSSRLGNTTAIRTLRQSGAPRLVAFLSHVKIPEVRDAVLAAGADRIVPNSAITQRLPDILSQLFARKDTIDPGDTDDSARIETG